jgi:hypothetical protein
VTIRITWIKTTWQDYGIPHSDRSAKDVCDQGQAHQRNPNSVTAHKRSCIVEALSDRTSSPTPESAEATGLDILLAFVVQELECVPGLLPVFRRLK